MESERQFLRRRRGGAEDHRGGEDRGDETGRERGFTTEEDTGIDEDTAPVPNHSLEKEGGEKLLSRVKVKKMAIRAIMGTTMMVLFAGVIHLGHAYICCLVFALQCFIFSELVGVRKKQAAERKLPLFRSIQWAWFLVANFWTWSGHVADFLGQSPKRFDAWTNISRFMLDYNMMISFSLYAVLLVVSVLSLRKGLYRYQLTQYTWTVVTICIVVLQTQAVFQIVYAGLFWFVLPSSLVICNDIMAYYCGQFFGRRITKRRFLELSPNKTWEGFLGSAICTVVFAHWFSLFLCHYESMTCVPDNITFVVSKLACTPDQMYRPQPLREIGEQVLPGGLRQVIGFLGSFAPGLSASILEVEMRVAQLHAMALGLFASFVAPFGGFLSSAIKRAYGIKDFNNLIPGHGGMMDRFDCQFVMFLCTYVHHRTFCKAALTLDAVLGWATQLSLEEQQELLRQLQKQLAAGEGG